jgi:integrase/recombinase XerD
VIILWLTSVLYNVYSVFVGLENAMQYLTKDELRRLFQVAYDHNRNHHLALVTALWHGMRVSELTSLCGTDITADGQVIVRRLKGSNTTMQPIRRDADPLFDGSPLLALAAERRTLKLFPYCRSYFDQVIKRYGIEAGIHPDKLHMHALKHSVAMLLWDATQSLGKIQSYLGHVAASSTLCYLYEADARLAQQALAGIAI